MWRSLVARLLGVQEAAGSNPVIPTVVVLRNAAGCGERIAANEVQTEAAMLVAEPKLSQQARGTRILTGELARVRRSVH